MSTQEDSQAKGLTTEQIAAAGAAPGGEQASTPAQAPAGPPPRQAQNSPGPPPDSQWDGAGLAAAAGGAGTTGTATEATTGYVEDHGSLGAAHPDPGDIQQAPRAGAGATAEEGEGRVAAQPEPRASLLAGDELNEMIARWRDIQAQFVDEPRTAVQEADKLVAELMQRLAQMFARDRAELEHQWAGGNEVSTEDLRQNLRHYRSFFDRLLSA